MQSFYENGGEAVPTTIVKEVALAWESIEAKCRNATLAEQNTDMVAELEKSCAVKSTMRRQLARVEILIPALET